MGALAEYLHSISDVSTLELEGAPDITQTNTATPADFAGFGVKAMELAWESAAGDFRKEAIDALRNAAREELKDVDWTGALGVVGDVPFVGFIVKLVVGTALALGKLTTVMGNNSEDVTRGFSQYYTLDGARPTNVDGTPPYIAKNDPEWKSLNQDPWDWAGIHKIFGYANFKPRGATPRFSFEPALRPMTSEGIPFGLSVFKPEGRWERNKGIPIRCGSHGPVGFKKWMGCHPGAVTKRGKRKIRRRVFKKCFTLVEPVWHPFSIPAQGTHPLPVAGGVGGGVAWNPNELLISRQARILTYPADNLLADLETTARLASNMVQWLAANSSSIQFRKMAGGKLSGPPQLGILDATKRSKWAGAMFYLSETGSVVGYPEHADQPSPRGWGFSLGGTPMSLADANTVVGTTLAALTLRAAVLRNQKLCEALVGQGVADKLKGKNERLRAALLEGAKPKRLVPKPPRAGTPARSVSRVQVRPGRSPRGLRTGRLPSPPDSDFPWVKVAIGGAILTAGTGATVLYKTLAK